MSRQSALVVGAAALLAACAPNDAVRLESARLGQNTGVALVEAGEPVTLRPSPVVADRAAQLRLVLDSDEARDVMVEVQFLMGEPVAVETSLEAGPTELDLALPADRFVPDQAVAVQVRGGGARMRYPEPGTWLALGVTPIPTLRVEVVELTGGPAAADVTPGHLEALSERLHALFPVAEVELTLRSETLPFTGSATNASGLNSDVEALVALRGDTPPEVLTLGLYGSTSSGAGTASDHSLLPHRRVAVAPTLENASTRGDFIVAHELGHLLGAQHAPCDTDIADPGYPNPEGVVGEPVWDGLRAEWREPDTPDVMGYCNGVWIGPYSSGRIAEGLTWSW